MSRGFVALLCVLGAALVACPSFDYEGGRFGCDTDEECPAGFYCDTDVNGCEPDDGGSGGAGSRHDCPTLCARAVANCSTAEFPLNATQCSNVCGILGEACRSCLDHSNCSDIDACKADCGVTPGGGT